MLHAKNMPTKLARHLNGLSSLIRFKQVRVEEISSGKPGLFHAWR